MAVLGEVMSAHAARDGFGPGDPVSGWWSYLDEQTRREIDSHVLQDRRMTALNAAWDALRPLRPEPRPAEEIVHARYEALGDRVRRRPPDPLDVSSLAARAAAHPGRVAAIEALWERDTVHDWFVVLVAVLEDPDGEGHLATVHHRAGGPRPAPAAAEAGRAVADHLGVPFRFASPDVPDDRAPRWRRVR
ncbi:hypothetical protein [Streptomyces sp. NPDC046759]|uniref:hypothetical protein n=1 Tax=Streptomyces sp. NPDC046759 TaxID=3155019 RepID=UPI0033C5487D